MWLAAGPTEAGIGSATRERAVAFPQSYRGRMLTTGWILTELGDGLANPANRPAFLATLDTLQADPNITPEPPPARLAFLPSSIGLSILVSPAIRQLHVVVRWGDYRYQPPEGGQGEPIRWKRTDREEVVGLDVPDRTKQPFERDMPASNGLKVVLSVRPIPVPSPG